MTELRFFVHGGTSCLSGGGVALFCCMDYQAIIQKYYPEDNELRHILLVHSRSVADKALAIADRHPELSLDKQFLEEAAMLHVSVLSVVMHLVYSVLVTSLTSVMGVSVLKCYVPRASLTMLVSVNDIRGRGLLRSQIIAQQLPLPVQDFLPETMEEKVICYADKFFSKTHLDKEKTVEQAIASLSKFGEEGVERFREWVKMF